MLEILKLTRSGLVVVALLLMLIFKGMRPPVKNRVDDTVPILSTVSCIEKDKSIANRYISGLDGEVIVPNLLKAAQTGHYLLKITGQYKKVTIINTDAIESNIDDPSNYLIRLEAIGLDNTSRLIGEYSLTATFPFITANYTAEPGDNDLRIQLISLRTNPINVYQRAEVDLPILSSLNGDGAQTVVKKPYVQTHLPAALAAASKMKTYDIGGNLVAIGLKIGFDGQLAQLGVPLTAIGSGGDGKYVALLVNKAGEILALSSFRSVDLPKMVTAADGSLSSNFYYLPLPAELKASEQYFLIIDGKNVATNHNNSIEIGASPTSNGEYPKLLDDKLGKALLMVAELNAITTTSSQPTSELTLNSQGSSSIIYQTRLDYTDYFDVVAYGPGKKIYDFTSHTVQVPPGTALEYRISQDGYKLSALTISIPDDCRNAAVVALEYSLDGQHWSEINNSSQQANLFKTQFQPTTTAFIRIKAKFADSTNNITVHRLTIIGQLQK